MHSMPRERAQLPTCNPPTVVRCLGKRRTIA